MQKNKEITDNSYNNNLSSQKPNTTNPIDKTGLVAKINILGSGMNSSKMAHSSFSKHSEKIMNKRNQ